MDQQGAAAGRRSAATAMASPIAHLFAAQQAALGELMTGMDADTRWALLLGPEGSGRSTVVRALLDELRLATTAVAAFDARETPDVEHLGAGIRDQLGLPNKRKFLADDHSVSDIVASRSELRTPLVVVVDDADALSSTSVKWLAGLAASASRPETACYVVLVGAPELQDSASHAWARGGSGRASVCCILEPMTSTEVRRYVEQWRHSRGDTWVKFSDAAIQKIEMYAKGRPGLIGELCSRAVTLPSTRVTEQVSVEAVVETAERLGLGRASGSTDRARIEPSRRRLGGASDRSGDARGAPRLRRPAPRRPHSDREGDRLAGPVRARHRSLDLRRHALTERGDSPRTRSRDRARDGWNRGRRAPAPTKPRAAPG
jgi:MSHA biogenesis protein MshM